MKARVVHTRSVFVSRIPLRLRPTQALHDAEGSVCGYQASIRNEAEYVIVDLPGTGNRLAFGIDFDQTDLPEILGGLDAIIEAFPAIGAP